MSLLDLFSDASDAQQIIVALNRIALAVERLSPPLMPDDGEDEAVIDETPYIPAPLIVEEEIPNGARGKIVDNSIIDALDEGY